MKPAKGAGIALTVIGVLLLVIGGLAYIWGVPVTETTPGGWFSDPVTTWHMTYPYREMGTWLLGMGFTAVIVGIMIYMVQDYLYKPAVVEKIKIRCQYCGGLMDESAKECPGCGGR